MTLSTGALRVTTTGNRDHWTSVVTDAGRYVAVYDGDELTLDGHEVTSI